MENPPNPAAPTIAEAIASAIAIAGSQARLARLIGYSQVAVNKAKRRGSVSAEMAVAIERATGVPRHALRPDIYPAPQPSFPARPRPTSKE